MDLSQIALQCATNVMRCYCEFILGTQLGPYSGGECVIFAFEAQNEGRERIGIRLEHTPSQGTRDKVIKEVQHLKAIKAARIPHLPVLLGYSVSMTPSPFIALKWVDGIALAWSDSKPGAELRDGILRTVAQVNMDLLKVQESGTALHRNEQRSNFC